MDRGTLSWITDSLIGLVVAGTLWGSDAAWGAQATLAWDPNSETDLAGYRLYRGQSAGVYDQTVDVGNVTTFVDTGLQTEVTYYFVVTAYNTAGLESDPSNEVSFLAPNAPPTIGAICDQSVPQDSVVGPIPFTVDDVDNDPAALAVTATSSDTALVPDANIALAGAGTDRTITLTPVALSAGAAIITLRVADGLAFASTRFVLTVTVNPEPSRDMDRELVSPVSLQAVRGAAQDSGSDIAAESVSESDCPIRTPSIVLHGNSMQLRHRTTPGQHCRLQSAPRLTGPWTNVPESDRVADGQGNMQIEIPTATKVRAQCFFRWIEIRPRANR